MADTITSAQQTALCAILNADGPLHWNPDVSSIPGGVISWVPGVGSGSDPQWVYRVVRDDGRVRILRPDDNAQTLGRRGVFLGNRHEFNGRGWIPKFAGAIKVWLAATGAPE